MKPMLIRQCFNREIIKKNQKTIAKSMCLCFFFTMISREFSESNSECKILNNIVCGISLFNKNNTALSQPSREMFSAYDMSLAFA